VEAADMERVVAREVVTAVGRADGAVAGLVRDAKGIGRKVRRQAVGEGEAADFSLNCIFEIPLTADDFLFEL
jgi:hypothetical protein